jgi:hypothetical protein
MLHVTGVLRSKHWQDDEQDSDENYSTDGSKYDTAEFDVDMDYSSITNMWLDTVS